MAPEKLVYLVLFHLLNLKSTSALIIYIPIPWLTAPPAVITVTPPPVVTSVTPAPPVVTLPTVTPIPQVLNPTFQTSSQDIINVYRTIHQAPPATANNALTPTCQGCANGYATADSVATPCALGAASTGEIRDVFQTCPSPRLAAFQLMSRWYSEVINVQSYTNLQPSPAYQRFTQMVWASSTQFCCALSGLTPTRRCYASCIFTPAGNVNGLFATNVLPPV